MLVPDFEGLKAYGSNFKTMPEGEFIDCFRLVPSFVDRKPYYYALFDLPYENRSLIMDCKNFFVKAIEKEIQPNELSGFVTYLLSNLEYVYFEVYDNGQHNSLFEGLATRSEGLRHFFVNAKPGQDLK